MQYLLWADRQLEVREDSKNSTCIFWHHFDSEIESHFGRFQVETCLPSENSIIGAKRAFLTTLEESFLIGKV